jgi:ribosomal protein L7/L12
MVTEIEVQQLRSRINELEDRLKLLYRHLNLEYLDSASDPMLSPQIQAALRSGNKIEAIKLYREMTGVGLAEAKAAIDKAG